MAVRAVATLAHTPIEVLAATALAAREIVLGGGKLNGLLVAGVAEHGPYPGVGDFSGLAASVAVAVEGDDVGIGARSHGLAGVGTY